MTYLILLAYPPLSKSEKITAPSIAKIKHIQNNTKKYVYPVVHAIKAVPKILSVNIKFDIQV